MNSRTKIKNSTVYHLKKKDNTCVITILFPSISVIMIPLPVIGVSLIIITGIVVSGWGRRGPFTVGVTAWWRIASGGSSATAGGAFTRLISFTYNNINSLSFRTYFLQVKEILKNYIGIYFNYLTKYSLGKLIPST